MTFVAVDKVRKIYDGPAGPVEAVARATFGVGRNELVSILGPSGCGKSTLLMMIAGLEHATEGEIRIGGKPVTQPSSQTGIIFQDATLLPWKTAIGNVLYPARIRGLDMAAYRARARELLDLVGLAGFADHKPAQLSGGMRQRVAICRALAYSPHLLLLDEPFSALDAITRDEMNELLLTLWESLPNAAILVTHSIREAVLLSDRVLVMGRRPSTVLAEIAIPFPRPRDLDLVDTPEFARISAELRSWIAGSHDLHEAAAQRRRMAARLATLPLQRSP